MLQQIYTLHFPELQNYVAFIMLSIFYTILDNTISSTSSFNRYLSNTFIYSKKSTNYYKMLCKLKTHIFYFFNIEIVFIYIDLDMLRGRLVSYKPSDTKHRYTIKKNTYC